MKRPETKGWYWVKIPGRDREVVRVLRNNFGGRLAIRMVYSYGRELLSETKGWRWLGRAGVGGPMRTMRALTVCQPWAWALIHGPKRIENRTWHTSYRGPLLIHAGKSKEWLIDLLNDGTIVPMDEVVFGAIIGRVDLVACVRETSEKVKEDLFAEGPWCWVMENPQPIEPIPARGSLGFWGFDLPNVAAKAWEGK